MKSNDMDKRELAKEHQHVLWFSRGDRKNKLFCFGGQAVMQELVSYICQKVLAHVTGDSAYPFISFPLKLKQLNRRCLLAG